MERAGTAAQAWGVGKYYNAAPSIGRGGAGRRSERARGAGGRGDPDKREERGERGERREQGERGGAETVGGAEREIWARGARAVERAGVGGTDTRSEMNREGAGIGRVEDV